MAVLDAPPQHEASAVERVKVSVRAQTFLDVLQGAFESTWVRPEALSAAMREVSGSEEAKAGLCSLLSYMEALSPCLSRLCGVGGREGEASSGRQGKGRRKRRKRGGGGGSNVHEESVDDEEETAPEQRLSPAALGQDDKMDSDAGKAGVRRGEEAGLVVSLGGGGVGVGGGVVRGFVPPRRRNIGNRRRESSVQGVLGDRDLLGCVLAFVGGETVRQRVRTLGQVSLVCRMWREMSSCAALWLGVEREMVPALWREEQGGRRLVGRGRVVQYGRMLLAERRVWSERDWTAGLELHLEVFDRMDGLQMLSVGGPLIWRVHQGAGQSFLGVRFLGLPASPAVDVRGSSFSAATRDPEQRRFANIGAYFTQGHRSEYPCSLCVRVTVSDQRTGKGGLLWEGGKETTRRWMNVAPLWQQRLPEGSKCALSTMVGMVGGRVEGMVCSTIIFVCPEPDQQGVAEEEKLYRSATAHDNNETNQQPFSFILGSTDGSKVGSIIRSLGDH